MGRRSSGAWVRPTRRWAIYLRDAPLGANGREIICVYCQRTLEDLLNDDIFLTLDHIDPDGGHEAWNLISCCFECNTLKGRKSLMRFAQDLGVPRPSISRRLSIRRTRELEPYRFAAMVMLGIFGGVPRAPIVNANDWLAQYQFRDDDPEYEYLRGQESDHCGACGRAHEGTAAVF
jgi:hypothetical protein